MLWTLFWFLTRALLISYVVAAQEAGGSTTENITATGRSYSLVCTKAAAVARAVEADPSSFVAVRWSKTAKDRLPGMLMECQIFCRYSMDDNCLPEMSNNSRSGGRWAWCLGWDLSRGDTSTSTQIISQGKQVEQFNDRESAKNVHSARRPKKVMSEKYSAQPPVIIRSVNNIVTKFINSLSQLVLKDTV